MGFKDADWAYTVELPTSQKVVLVAIAHATDDKTHQTYRSQKTIASMVGMGLSTVNRAVGVLEDLGIITREHRNGIGGYRSSDIITVNPAYVPQTNVGQTNVGDTNIGLSSDLHAAHAEPTSRSGVAEEITHDHPDDHPISAAPATKRSTATGSRLPDGWTPTADTVTAMKVKAPLVDLKAEHENFTDYWISVPGAKGRKTNWDATWRNWMRKANSDIKRITAPKQWEKPVGRPMTLAEERAQYREAS